MPRWTQNCGVRRLPLDFRDQYFGCEIELTGINRATAAQTLADLFGTRAEHSGGGYDAYRVKDLDGKEWKIVRDGSIHPECRRRSVLIGETYKVELNSPKLEYSEMEKLQEVVRSLRRAGGIVNDSCGITDIAHPDNPNLHRIRAVTDLTEDVLAGMLGGYVESYDNLDQEGRAWISEDAIACENAVVCGDAVLTDHAVARGDAYVGNNAMMTDHAIAQDDAAICGGLLTGESCVCGYAVIRQDEQTLCAPIIDGSARVYGEISGNVVCRGNAVVLPGTKLDNRTQDCFVLEDDRVSVQTASRTPPPKEPRTHDFER